MLRNNVRQPALINNYRKLKKLHTHFVGEGEANELLQRRFIACCFIIQSLIRYVHCIPIQ